MTIFKDLPFDQAGGHGGNRTGTQMIVIHATDNTASDEAEAHYAEHRSDEVSAHFYNDGDSVTQALDTDLVAYGCYPIGNARSVQFELVGLSNRLADQTLREVAPIVARVCKLYGIPVQKIGPADLVNGVRGICGHADVTNAWHQGDHQDPGTNFPWSTFIGYVQTAYQPKAVPTGDEMIIAKDGAGKLYLCDGMTSRPIQASNVNDIKYLASQGLMTLGHGSPGAEWDSSGYIRTGWNEAEYGTLPVTNPTTVSVALTTQQIQDAVRAVFSTTKLDPTA